PVERGGRQLLRERPVRSRATAAEGAAQGRRQGRGEGAGGEGEKSSREREARRRVRRKEGRDVGQEEAVRDTGAGAGADRRGRLEGGDGREGACVWPVVQGPVGRAARRAQGGRCLLARQRRRDDRHVHLLP